MSIPYEVSTCVDEFIPQLVVVDCNLHSSRTASSYAHIIVRDILVL